MPDSPPPSPILSPTSVYGSLYGSLTAPPEVSNVAETLAVMKGSLGNLGVSIPLFLENTWTEQVNGELVVSTGWGGNETATLRFVGTPSSANGPNRWTIGDSAALE